MYAAVPLEYELVRAGFRASVAETAELLHYQSELCRGAVVVLISRSGETVEILKLLAALEGMGAVTIGVTSVAESTLARSVRHALAVPHLPDEMVAIQSYTATVLALALLGGAAGFDGLAERVEELAQRCAGAIGEWDEFLDGAAAIHLLARGPSCASAMEGALLFNETAKFPACAAPAGSFRHGPVEIVEEGFRAIVFAADEPARTLNEALAADLARFGGAVRVIGPQIPPLPGVLRAVAEIVPVQFAALRLAQLRGVTPGSFRYAPQVTSDETRFR
jgi:glucosamine--fructose-6-phosphate aminotransferase (isomerizing)